MLLDADCARRGAGIDDEPIEIVRITTPSKSEGGLDTSAWTVRRVETVDDAAKVMKARFIHAVVVE